MLTPLASTTGLVATTAAADFVFETASTTRTSLVVFQDGVGAGENLPVYIVAPNGTLIPALDENGADATIVLDVTAQRILVGGPTYLLRSPGTAATITAFIAPCVR